MVQGASLRQRHSRCTTFCQMALYPGPKRLSHVTLAEQPKLVENHRENVLGDAKPR